MKRALAGIGVGVIAMISLGSVAGAQAYPPADPNAASGGASAAPASSALPKTGSSNSTEIALAGVGAVGIGTAMIVAARRRRDARVGV